jgi:hypothetical protein
VSIIPFKGDGLRSSKTSEVSVSSNGYNVKKNGSKTNLVPGDNPAFSLDEVALVLNISALAKYTFD